MRVAIVLAALLTGLLGWVHHLDKTSQRRAAARRALGVPVVAIEGRLHGAPATRSPAAEQRARGTWLALAYGGNSVGEVEPCG